jgi:hypothetical protein
MSAASAPSADAVFSHIESAKGGEGINPSAERSILAPLPLLKTYEAGKRASGACKKELVAALRITTCMHNLQLAGRARKTGPSERASEQDGRSRSAIR